MKLIEVDKHKRKEFVKFYESRYLNHEYKRNSMSSLLKGLLYDKSVMCRSIEKKGLMVEKNGQIVMACLLVWARRMPDYLQISFFEAAEKDGPAFGLLLAEAQKMAREKKASKISGSLNVHVNYGLGFLTGGEEQWQSFGSSHNPDFYNGLFLEADFEPMAMESYEKRTTDMGSLLPARLSDRLKQRYSVRTANFKDLQKEAEIYTRINNRAFADHLFYYERSLEEDLELFKDFKYFLKPEHLLFVERNQEPVGFMLWYPDFHQLMKPGETLALKTVVKNRLFAKKIDTFKVVEIGVVPEEQKKGAILALFDECYRRTRGQYKFFESGWVLEENRNSGALGEKWADGVCKKYRAYILDLDKERKAEK